MAEGTQGAIVIDAEAAAIMAEIVDFESYPEWSGEIREVKVKQRYPDGRAELVAYEVAAGPITAKYTLRYDYRPDDAGVSWTFVEGSGIKDLEGEYRLEPAGAGRTNVTYRVAIDVAIPGPGFVRRKVMAEGEKRIIDAALKGLKQRVESKRG